MHKNKFIFLAGLLIAAIPFSGFTWNTKKIIIAVLGVLVSVLAILVERHIKISFHWPRKKNDSPTATTYVEHNGAEK